MKIISLFLLIVATAVNAQTSTTISFYLDALEQPTELKKATYRRTGIKKDSLWQVTDYYLYGNKVHMKGWSMDDSLYVKHGSHEFYYQNGKLSSKGMYANGKKEGTWESYFQSGKKQSSVSYKNDVPVGVATGIYENGVKMFEMDFDKDGKGTTTNYYENGAVRSSGSYKNNKRTDTWLFFRENKTKASEVIFNEDTAVSIKNFNESGILTSSNLIEQEASYPGGEQMWIAYISKELGKLTKKKDYLSYSGACVLQFIVETDGSIMNCEIIQSNNPLLAAEAIEVIKKSKKWNPAIQYNLSLKAYRRQPVIMKFE
jgi:antitoxin component YwqK of YwqJK toxin-antitoxin module